MSQNDSSTSEKGKGWSFFMTKKGVGPTWTKDIGNGVSERSKEGNQVSASEKPGWTQNNI